ncbi:hypothetical protein HMPREF9975_00717, partial [Staphylococcus epidermidis NIHLM001]
GEPGTKTITTPTTKNPLTGEKVGEGEPTEKITKQPVDENHRIMVAKKSSQAIRMNLIRTHRKVVKQR